MLMPTIYIYIYYIYMKMSVKITTFIIVLLLGQISESKEKIMERLRQYDDGGISMVLSTLQESTDGLY